MTEKDTLNATDQEETLACTPEADGEAPACQAPEPSNPEELRDELSKCRAETESLKNRLQYLAADFDNYQKRVLKNEERTNFRIRKDFLLGLLPIVDDIERGVVHARNGAGKQCGDGKAEPRSPEAREASIIQGMEMIYQNVMGFLEKQGVTKIDCLYSQFDPYLHEAVMMLPNKEHDDGTILEVFQNGYRLNKETIRAAKVTVSKKED